MSARPTVIVTRPASPEAQERSRARAAANARAAALEASYSAFYNAALATLLSRATQLAHRYSLTPDAAPDLAQEALARAWRNWATLAEQPSQNRLAWTMRVLRNCCTDALRHSQYAPSQAVSLDAPASATPLAPAPEELVEARIALEDVTRRLARHGRAHSLVALLAAAAAGYRVGEIAEEFHITRASAKAALARGRVEARAVAAEWR